MFNMETRDRNVVIYARVSTEHEAQINALENQLDWYKPILEMNKHLHVVDWYVDKGITGTSAAKRPQFMQMMEDAKKKRFDLIITREVSRFARNTVDTLQYTRMLKEHKVEVLFINDGIRTFDGDGELRLSLMATLAQDESRKTSVRVKAGMQTSMNNGVFYGTGNILGYRRKQSIDENNKKKVEFLIDPEQAKTVRLIYDMYLDGCGLQKIMYELEHRGMLTATGKTKWHCTVISNVLKNTFYCGIITYHKEYVDDYLKQKKKKNYGEIELTQVKGSHEPIVTVEEYERVQTIMESKRRTCESTPSGKSGTPPRKDLWTKLLVCSCGHQFSKRVWTRKGGVVNPGYLCYFTTQHGSVQTRINKGLSLEGACDTPMIPEWKLRMQANIIFREFLHDKEKVLELCNSILQEHDITLEEESHTEEIFEQKQAELERQNKKRENLMDMRVEGVLSKEEFDDRMKPIEKAISDLSAQISELTPKNEPEIEIPNYEEKIEVLRYALEQYNNWDDKDVPDAVIEAYVEKIVASKDGFEWYLRFDGDTNDPIKCKVNGKRRQTAIYTIGGKEFPTDQKGNAGCHQGSEINNIGF